MSTAAERIAARQRGPSTAASRIASGKSGRTTAAERYQHPTGGAKGKTFLAEQAPKVKPTGVWTPIQAAFDYISRPAYAVGNIAAGRPVEAGKNLLNLVAPPSAAIPGLSGRKTYISEVAREKGWLPGGKLGVALGFGLDVGTDPTTWVTFGAGTGVSVGAKAASRAASLQIAEQTAKQGRRLLPKEIAEITAEAARTKAALPRELTVGLRLPFTRGKSATIARSTKIPAAASKVAGKLPGAEQIGFGLSKGVSPRRGVIPEVDDVYQAARRVSETWARDFSRQASKLNRDILRAEKALPDLKPGQGAELIARHLDNPTVHPLPDVLRPHAETAKRILDEIDRLEDVAGITKGKVANYVPHLPARPKDQEAYRSAFAQSTANSIDDPFFVKPRVTENLDEFEAAGERFGFKPELNIARIIEKRARASFTAQTKKAVDDALFGQHAPAPKRIAPPEPQSYRAGAGRGSAPPEPPPGHVRLYRGQGRVKPTDVGDQMRRHNYADKLTFGKHHFEVEPEHMGRWFTARKDVAETYGAKQGADVYYVDVPREVAEKFDLPRSKVFGDPMDEVLLPQEIANRMRLLKGRDAKRPSAAIPPRQQAKQIHAEARDRWRTIATANVYHAGKELPDEVAASLERLHKNVMKSTQSDEGLAAIGRFAANLGGRWKALALLSPGFHARNMLDDGVRAYWAGARNPVTFNQAFWIITGKRGKSVRIKGKTYSPDEILALAESVGVIRTGFVRSEIASSADTVRRGRFQGPGRGPLVRASGELGQVREDTTRLFVFLERLKAGDDLLTAANVTRDALFDYGQVGKFVEMARRFWIPFITFPSKAIPYTLRTAATKPGLLANTAKAIEASNVAAGSPDLSVLPPWTPSAFAVPTSPAFRRLVGAPADQQLVLDPERVTAWASLNLLDPRRSELRQNLSGMINPLASTPAEMLTNYDLFFGRGRAKYVKQPWIIQQLAGLGVPIPGAGEKRGALPGEASVPGYSPDLASFLEMLPIFGQASYAIPGGGSESPRLGPTKFLTGFPLTPYDRARQAALAEKYR